MDKTLLEVIEDSRNIAMNALEKADQLVHPSHQWGFNWPLISESAEILRQQHEAIVKLRSALLEIATTYRGGNEFQKIARKALKDSEDLKWAPLISQELKSFWITTQKLVCLLGK